MRTEKEIKMDIHNGKVITNGEYELVKKDFHLIPVLVKRDGEIWYDEICEPVD